MGAEAKSIVLREAKAADAPALADLEAASFPDAWNERMLLEELSYPLSSYFVLEKEGQLCGYGGFLLVAGEAQITRVAVSPGCRGLGLGNRLSLGLVEKAFCLGAEAVTLEVRENNSAALKAYLYAGFKAVGVRPRYYENAENAVIMWLYKKETVNGS